MNGDYLLNKMELISHELIEEADTDFEQKIFHRNRWAFAAVIPVCIIIIVCVILANTIFKTETINIQINNKTDKTISGIVLSSNDNKIDMGEYIDVICDNTNDYHVGMQVSVKYNKMKGRTIYADSIKKIEANDLVYREYGSGFALDGEKKIFISWNGEKLEPEDIDKVILYRLSDKTVTDITSHFLAGEDITIEEKGYYYVYAVMKDGEWMDLMEVVKLEYVVHAGNNN